MTLARAALLLAALAPGAVAAQVFVYPRRPDKSHVRYFDFQWRHIDILVGPEADRKLMDESPHQAPAIPVPPPPGATPEKEKQLLAGDSPTLEDTPPGPTAPPPPSPKKAPKVATKLDERTGGVRLYFYDREQAIAERAAASITASYRKLVEQFRYVPTQTFPYILYSSYQEFLQTNLFPLQEGVLGVTSPRDLKLTLPYLGDHRMFQEVSAHEMAHQFTIQKVRTLSTGAGGAGDPLLHLPLWFIEGLAELYAQGGVAPEAEMLVRDILLNPDVERGYAMLDFFEDRPFSVLWTYKAGNVRCAFLEDVYGSGFVQRVLEASVGLAGGGRLPGSAPAQDFAALLERLTGDPRATLSAKFEDWIKRRAYRAYLDAEQDAAELRRLREDHTGAADELVQTMTASPDGEVLLLRGIGQETGESRLMLVHREAPDRPLVVAIDGQPGVESLHPISDRSFALSGDQLAFIAESRGRDVLYVQPYRWRQEGPSGRLRLGARRSVPLGELGLVAAYSPSFSPDGKRLAFVGLSSEGNRDVYVAALDRPDRIEKVTDDAHAERQVSWGPSGIVFTSDATSHGRYNLFRVRPEEPGRLERLTREARDEQDPLALPDGRIFFVAYQGARADLHELVGGEIIRRTNVTTGLFDASPGPGGALWALFHRSGQRQPVQVPPEQLLSSAPLEQPPAEPAAVPPLMSLGAAEPYRPFSPKNWELGPVFGIVGGGTGGIVGQLLALARDRLGNHAALLELNVFGSFQLTDGVLLYINQEKRLTYGGGIFQALRFREDKTFADLPFRFFSGERFYGAMATVRYPFNRYVYLQADAAVGGVAYFLLDGERLLLSVGDLTGGDRYPEWEAANAGARFQTEGTLRFGYDTLRYHPATGPLAGSSLLLEGTLAVQPLTGESFGNLRADAGKYFPIYGRSNFFLRGGAGTTLGGRLAREFFLSSFDTLRGVRFGDPSRLLGRSFVYTTAELQIPLNGLIRVLVLTDIEAVLGADFGGVGHTWLDAWDRRVLDGVLGLNFSVGPLLFRLHFAKNVGVGAPAGLPVPAYEWVTNFSIGIAGLGGPFGDRPSLAHTHPRL